MRPLRVHPLTSLEPDAPVPRASCLKLPAAPPLDYLLGLETSGLQAQSRTAHWAELLVPGVWLPQKLRDAGLPVFQGHLQLPEACQWTRSHLQELLQAPRSPPYVLLQPLQAWRNHLLPQGLIGLLARLLVAPPRQVEAPPQKGWLKVPLQMRAPQRAQQPAPTSAFQGALPGVVS